ncbi:AI-2E family transporter [Desertimonas flava]|uniref:AI-2E family transporter n=1 Tax=Desertimonas flava TaxID=2064846 RepID=UPI0013C52806|nr:AI-2E family transporter [Desertimonas flava]
MSDRSTGTSTTPGAYADRTRLVGITPASAVLVVAAVVVAYLLRDAFVAAHRTVGWVVACSIVALLIDPVIGVLQRLLPRWLSVIAVLVGVVGVVGVVVAGLANEILNSIEDLRSAAPDAASRLEERYDWAADVGVAERVERMVEQLETGVRESAVDQALATLPTYLVTGILMLFLLAYGRRYLNALLDQFDDVERRLRWRAVGERTISRGRIYLLCTIAHAVVNGIVFGLVCWFFDLPAPLSLGFAVAALTPIPVVGVIVGGIPALLLAFGAESGDVGAATLIVIVALQVGETIIVRPLVDRRSVRLGPTVPIVVGLAAFELYGVGAAVYAIALAVLSLAALDAVGWVQGDDPHPENLKESGIAIDESPGGVATG